MSNFGVCIETFFIHLPYEQRIREVAKLGIKNYEFWFHDKSFDGINLKNEDKDFDRIRDLNTELGLTCTDFIFNHPDGGIVASLIVKEDQKILINGLKKVVQLARKINCKAFISGSGNVVQGITKTTAFKNMVSGLKLCAEICASEGITLLFEPFNTKVDHPDYFLDDPQLCIDVIKEVNHPNIKMLYDIYHMQIMAGNVIQFIRENIEFIGHFHIAGVPGRHEPMGTELNWPQIIKDIDNLGFLGGIGLEFWPTIDPKDSIIKTIKYLSGQL